MLGTSIPLVVEFAKEHEMHPLVLGLIWTFAAGGKLFAYQSCLLSAMLMAISPSAIR
jgi:solute carrier family 13 (sodium-dependent dicarboxylate transporter), member 2/3/5